MQKLQDGSTDFEFLPIDVSLGRCQRYFQFVGGVSNGFPIFHGYGGANEDIRVPVSFPVQMRASPTATVSGTWQTFNSAGNPICEFISKDGYAIRIDMGATTGQAFVHVDSTDDKITFDSEL